MSAHPFIKLTDPLEGHEIWVSPDVIAFMQRKADGRTYVATLGMQGFEFEAVEEPERIAFLIHAANGEYSGSEY